jgi:hypothetical protein
MNSGERDARDRRGLKRGEKSKKVRGIRNQQKGYTKEITRTRYSDR